MALRKSGASSFWIRLLETNYLNGAFSKTDWLDHWIVGSEDSKTVKKLKGSWLSDSDLREKFELAATESRILVHLTFAFQSGQFGKVRSQVEHARAKQPNRNIESYFEWFDLASRGRSDLEVASELTAETRPDLHSALLALDKCTLEAVSIIFDYVTRLAMDEN